MSTNSTLSNEIAALVRGEILDQRYREGERLPSGMAMGTLNAASATALHQAGDIQSFQLIQAMSDALAHDSHYEGPGVHFQQWLRVLDPRTSEQQRRSIMSSLQEKDGQGRVS